MFLRLKNTKISNNLCYFSKTLPCLFMKINRTPKTHLFCKESLAEPVIIKTTNLKFDNV